MLQFVLWETDQDHSLWLQRAARMLGGSSLVRSELVAYGSCLLACVTCSSPTHQSVSMETVSSVVSPGGGTLYTFPPLKLSCKREGSQTACLTPHSRLPVLTPLGHQPAESLGWTLPLKLSCPGSGPHLHPGHKAHWHVAHLKLILFSSGL